MNIPSINVAKNGCWQSPDGSTKSIPRFVQRYELEYFLDDGGETWIDGVHYKCSQFQSECSICAARAGNCLEEYHAANSEDI